VKKIEVEAESALRLGPPTSVVLATCISLDGKPNVITLGMYMPVSIRPPLVAIGVAPKRYSHALIRETGEFAINVPGKDLVRAMEICGTLSGKEHDKFSEAKLTPIPGKYVKPPLIKECVAHMECQVVEEHVVGDRTLFIGEVLVGHVDEHLFDKTLDLEKAPTILHKAGEFFWPMRIE